MSKFRVNDLVEIVKCFKPENQCLIGAEARVLATGLIGESLLNGLRTDRIRLDIQVVRGDQDMWLPEQLRLKRPPSWSKWIYDTSNVDEELVLTNNVGA